MPLVYVVQKNRDTIEGAGPMLLDSVFLDKGKAFEYATEQSRRYASIGTATKWTEYPARTASDGTIVHRYWTNGWGMHEIVEMEAKG